eukprot:TRINITY_DN359_c0_g2_i1.p1 TRINITY_DN359_c0_g2~~TRINITY_DN359_c0_g2_i1.p1  ORF type:complete len:814 (+),score=177.15 TRINITY_DN359_c0_g2_i1:167-2608(+)
MLKVVVVAAALLLVVGAVAARLPPIGNHGSGVWSREHVKQLDPRGDDNDPVSENKDIVAVYYAQADGAMHFRVDLFDYCYGDDQWVDVVVLLDYEEGGSHAGCPGTEGAYYSAIAWDACFVMYGHASGDYFTAAGERNASKVAGVWADGDVQMMEARVLFPDGFQAGWRVNFEVYTAYDGKAFDVVQGVSSDSVPNTGKVVFLNHGNQALGWTDVLRGRSGWEEHTGFDEVMRAHEYYGVAGNFHLSGVLTQAALWHDPGFVDWLRAGAHAGRWDLLASAYSQHVMPFVFEDMNYFSVGYHKELLWHVFGYDPKAAWVPERCWDWPYDDHTKDYVATVWGRHYLGIVVLEESVHGLDAPNPRKVYRVNGAGDLKVVFRDQPFNAAMHMGDRATVKSILLNIALSPDPEQLTVYADDWEMPAGVAGWDWIMPPAHDTYWWAMFFVATHPWVQPVKLGELSTWPWREDVLTLRHGTFPNIGGEAGYGGYSTEYGRNSWYAHWARYVHPGQGGRSFGQVWTESHAQVAACPHNALRKAAWLVLLANMFELAWHDGVGGPISGWQLKCSTHIKNAKVFADASQWAARANASAAPEAFSWDFDEDGEDELCVRNGRLMAVIERNGGRVQWLFTADNGGDVIIGNDVVYYPSSEGDYNDDAHLAALSDVWYKGADHEHERYDVVKVEQRAQSASITLRSASGDITKRVTAVRGRPHIYVQYVLSQGTWDGEPLYVQSGFTPGLVDLLLEGRRGIAAEERPRAVVYRNRVSGVCGGVAWGAGVALTKRGDRTYLLWLELAGRARTFGFRLMGGAGADACV